MKEMNILLDGKIGLKKLYDTAVNLSKHNFSIHFVNPKREIALSIPTNLSQEEKENYINSFLEALKPSYSHQSFRYEDIPLYKITVTHPKNSSLSQEEFTEKILGVCKRFGAIISHISHYCETNKGKNPNVNGFLFVYMYSAVFTIPFVSLAAEAMFGNDFAVLKIPAQLNIDPITLAKDRKMLNIMKNWLADNDLDIQLSKNKWVGPQTDVNKASELLKSSPPAFPTKFISIPGGVDIIRLNAELKRLSKAGKKKWFVNFISKTITVPSDTDDEKVKSFMENYKQIGGSNQENDEVDDEELEYIGDVSFCGNDSLSTKLLNVYKEDGTVQTKNFCKNCIRDSLISSLGRLYDDDNDTPIMNRIFENIDFINPITLLFSEEGNPIIPIGQLLLAFIQDANIATPAKSYITALALQTLKKSPYVTCCPEHPTILYRKPQRGIPLKCIISGCKYVLCTDCYKWHKPGDCPEKILVPKGCRVCPNCGAIVEKSMACNKLLCNCGKVFCYYCGAGPYNDCSPCYSHLSEKHGDCFNDPPDYRKFIKKDGSVTDKELEDFYCKYENIRNLKA